MLDPPRPGSRSERGMPIKFMLYLTAGMPTAAQFSMSALTTSISRSRSGSIPSMMLGASAVSIGVEERGSWIMSNSMPKELTCSPPTGEIVLLPGMSIALSRVVAYVDDPELRPLPQVNVVSRSDLGSYVHVVGSPIGWTAGCVRRCVCSDVKYTS